MPPLVTTQFSEIPSPHTLNPEACWFGALLAFAWEYRADVPWSELIVEPYRQW